MKLGCCELGVGVENWGRKKNKGAANGEGGGERKMGRGGWRRDEGVLVPCRTCVSIYWKGEEGKRRNMGERKRGREGG